jgi:hypothetical protein
VIRVAPHVLLAADALKVGYNRGQPTFLINASLEYDDMAALDLAVDGLPQQDVDCPPLLRLPHLAL